MDWFRSKELRTQMRSIQEWATTTRSSKYRFHYDSKVHVPASIWEDITVRAWLSDKLPLDSQVEFATAMVQAPITDIQQLQQRQATLKMPQRTLVDKTMEAHVQWFLSSPVIDKNYLFKVLFPGSWYLGWVKLHPELLRLYQWYSVYFTTASSLFYPLSVLFGPFWVLRYKLGFPLTLAGYFKMLFNLVKMFKNNLKQLVGIFAYCGFYLYSLIQNIDLSLQLHRLRCVLLEKVRSVCVLLNKVRQVARVPWWSSFEEIELGYFPVQPNLYWVYRLLTRPEDQERLFRYFKVATVHDTLFHLRRLNYPIVAYGSVTYFHHMGNPLLGDKQVVNPLLLKKNLIVSGPNAGGKTTYVKSLLWNILLGQSFGVAICSSGCIKPYDAILHHHRVKDIVGDNSLFQAEMAKVKEAIYCLGRYKSVIYFMDEPLHSTHPIDGAAMLKALLYYLGEQENCSVVVTSHYFSIQSLPGYYNVSVRAVLSNESDAIDFDYKIYPGGSKQTIGIELLRREDFPVKILESAVKLKNKIYAGTVNV